MQEAIQIVKSLNNSEIFELIAPFVPEPMIDMFSADGVKHWVKKESDGSVKTYFTK